MIYIKLYKKHEININEKILFAISVIPFLWGIKEWEPNDSYYIWRWFLNPYSAGTPHNSDIFFPKMIYWNFVLVRYVVITIILLYIISNLRKENKMKYADFLSFNFVFVGIYQTMRNLECFNMNMYGVPELRLILDHREMMMKIFILPAPLYFGILCALVTMITYSIRTYFPKPKSYKDET
jgi:hypothetical protein